MARSQNGRKLTLAVIALSSLAVLSVVVGYVVLVRPGNPPAEPTRLPVPTPTAHVESSDRLEQRMDMVETQIRRRGVTDQDVIPFGRPRRFHQFGERHARGHGGPHGHGAFFHELSSGDTGLVLMVSLFSIHVSSPPLM